MTPKITTEIFIQRASEKHGDKYDYSKVEYKDAKYTSRSEFALHAASAYIAAKSNMWLSQYTWFVEKHKPNGYWTIIVPC